MSWVSFVPASQGPNPELCAELDHRAGLLLMLSFGPKFAAQTAYEESAETAHPFDTRSAELARRFAVDAGLTAARLVYPGDVALDLRGWLAAARVQFSSPLGTGVRPDCGPWLAVRAALVVTLAAAQREALARRFPKLADDASPCAACVERPCMRACPVGAVRDVGNFALHACIDERVRDGSKCGLRCDARLACPVGAAFRYPDAQLRHHYGASLRTIRRYRAEVG
jgi:hypothetical protein